MCELLVVAGSDILSGAGGWGVGAGGVFVVRGRAAAFDWVSADQ